MEGTGKSAGLNVWRVGKWVAVILAVWFAYRYVSAAVNGLTGGGAANVNEIPNPGISMWAANRYNVGVYGPWSAPLYGNPFYSSPDGTMGGQRWRRPRPLSVGY